MALAAEAIIAIVSLFVTLLPTLAVVTRLLIRRQHRIRMNEARALRIAQTFAAHHIDLEQNFLHQEGEYLSSLHLLQEIECQTDVRSDAAAALPAIPPRAFTRANSLPSPVITRDISFADLPSNTSYSSPGKCLTDSVLYRSGPPPSRIVSILCSIQEMRLSTRTHMADGIDLLGPESHQQVMDIVHRR